MNFFLRLGSYLFHPFWIPTLATLYNFWLNPPPYPISLLRNKLMAIVALTLLAPAIFVLLADRYLSTKKQSSAANRNNQILLLFWILLLITTNKFVLHLQFPELFYFTIGLLLSLGLLFLLSLINLKISLHTNCLAALLAFILASSLFHHTSSVYLIAFLIFSIGWVISGERAKKKHSKKEILLGLLTGIFPQALLFSKILLIHKI